MRGSTEMNERLRRMGRPGGSRRPGARRVSGLCLGVGAFGLAAGGPLLGPGGPAAEERWFVLALLLAVLLVAALCLCLHYRRQVERTCRRIADDLHDDVGSKLSSIALAVEMVSHSDGLSRDDQAWLLDAARGLRDLVDDLRDTIWLVDAEGTTLAELVERMQLIARQMLQGVESRVVVPPDVPPRALRRDVRRHVLMIYKEALHNALRHAGASRIDVTIAVRGGELVLQVCDDGRGFDEQCIELGKGLRSMRRRIRHLKADLALQSRRGQGTTVQLQVSTS